MSNTECTYIIYRCRMPFHLTWSYVLRFLRLWLYLSDVIFFHRNLAIRPYTIKYIYIANIHYRVAKLKTLRTILSIAYVYVVSGVTPSLYPHKGNKKFCLTTAGIKPTTFEMLAQNALPIELRATKSLRVHDIFRNRGV